MKWQHRNNEFDEISAKSGILKVLFSFDFPQN